MSDIFKCVERLLNDNGVRVDIEELQPDYPDDDVRCIRIEKNILTLDFSEHDKVFEDKIASLEEKIGYHKDSLSRVEKNCDKLYHENKELKQRIDELESKNNQLTESILRKETKIHELESKETQSFDEVPDDITIDGYKCKIIKTESGLYISRDEIYSIIDKEKEPLKQKCKELEDRHQSNCIEVNRLNTAIDVLIHKVEYLRQFAGLE